MPARRPLPEDPSLENLKKQAKGLLKSVRAGAGEALAQVRELHPRAEAVLQEFTLSEAQLVIARSYDFASWSRLKQHLAVVDRFLWDPPPATPSEGRTEPLADTFVRLACLIYGDWHPSSAVKARALLAEHPELARANVYAAAATGRRRRPYGPSSTATLRSRTGRVGRSAGRLFSTRATHGSTVPIPCTPPSKSHAS